MSWNRSIDDFCDTATFTIPAICRLTKNGDQYDRVPTALQFTEGMPVEMRCGYDYRNVTRFKGFVKRINSSVPVVIECEGYCYQLRQLSFNKSYASVQLRDLLAELIIGTSIKLSDSIPDLLLSRIYFHNVKRVQVLEYLKSRCFLTVHFDFDVLYAGLEQAQLKKAVQFKLGWNTIDDDGLKFETNKELAQLTVRCEARLSNGQRLTSKSVPASNTALTGIDAQQETVIKVANIYDQVALQKIADRKRVQLVYKGYEGQLTAFAMPYAEPGMAAIISDDRYPDRTGRYFIDKVAGEFGPNGGRQVVSIGNSLSVI